MARTELPRCRVLGAEEGGSINVIFDIVALLEDGTVANEGRIILVSTKSIIVIGAGIAGLSAGCYAQMNGFDSQIFELHTIPGGLCTSWRREGYLFDGAIRYLVGSGPRAKAHRMWQELGALHNRPVVNYADYLAVEDHDGRAFHFYTDVDRLEDHMLSLAANDRSTIRQFTNAVRSFADFDLPLDPTPDDALENLQMGMTMLPFVGPLLRWNNTSLRNFAARFRDPLLRTGLVEFMQFAPADFPLMLALTTLSQLSNGIAGYPIGGSLAFAESIARRYEALGGTIHYQSRVARILVCNDRAVGVQLEDGSEVQGDIIISAADGRRTIFDLLQGRSVDESVAEYYRTLSPAQSIVQVSLGVARDFSQEPPALSFPLAQPIQQGRVTLDRLVVKHYSFDPTMAPKRKSVLTLWCEANYDDWLDLRQTPAAYEAEKQRLADAVVHALDVRYPGLAAKTEVVDVATPVTYERYTGNWRGSIFGWAMSKRKLDLMMGGGMAKTLPALGNFYMIGQWVEPGGNVQLSAASGRDVLEIICRQEKQPFITACL